MSYVKDMLVVQDLLNRMSKTLPPTVSLACCGLLMPGFLLIYIRHEA